MSTFSRIAVVAALGAVMSVGLTACGGSGPPNFVGTWSVPGSNDTKFINDDGTCEQWIEIDTGGTMRCDISSKADVDGAYTLTARQTGNVRTYHLTVVDDDTLQVKSAKGNFTLKRQ